MNIAKLNKIGKYLILFSIIATILIVAIADVFNKTHLFNDLWPKHAKFHIGMQFTTLIFVSAYSYWGWLNKNYNLAIISSITFWPSLFLAWVIPGTSPYATASMEAAGIPINLFVAAIMILLTAIGYKFVHLK